MVLTAHDRQTARELIELLVVMNRATNADQDAWRELTKKLSDRANEE